MTDAPAMAGSGTRSSAALYADSLDEFLRASDDEVYAPLTSPDGYTLAPEQLSAWRLQLPVLRAVLADFAARAAAEAADSPSPAEVTLIESTLEQVAVPRSGPLAIRGRSHNG